jgi:hypothetical protein
MPTAKHATHIIVTIPGLAICAIVLFYGLPQKAQHDAEPVGDAEPFVEDGEVNLDGGGRDSERRRNIGGLSESAVECPDDIALAWGQPVPVAGFGELVPNARLMAVGCLEEYRPAR